DLINYGYVRRPYLGVLAQDVTAVDVEVFDLSAAMGAKVVQIAEGSPAASAGLELGDVIVAIDDRAIESASDLQAYLAELEPGSRVRARLIRDGEERVVPIELGLIETGGPPPPPTLEEIGGPLRLGFSVTEEAGRVVVATVSPYSAAARAGIRPGQAILSVNR